MAKRDGQMKLGVFIMQGGHHVAGWRHPESTDMTHLRDYIEVAQAAEKAKFDYAFIADVVASSLGDIDTDRLMATSATISAFEPLTLLSALSVATSHIGLVATASTSYSEPYNLARMFSSLDRLSDGRAGWNIVTSFDVAAGKNFSETAPSLHDARYARAEEYVDVVRGLWDSWDDDAFVRDRQSGLYFDPEKFRYLNHEGPHYKVRGPLNLPRSPQGHPLLVQAGSSGPGKQLAARVADVIFTSASDIDVARKFYSDVKSLAADFGRLPHELLIMPGVYAVVANSEKEAQEKQQQLRDLLSPNVALRLLSVFCSQEIDLRRYPLDGPVPTLPKTEGHQSRQAIALELARRENLTLGELAKRFSDARANSLLVGTPECIADQLEHWYCNHAADGFMLMPSTLPGGLDDFAELVVPVLQKRGLFRTDYEGATLRENLGLARPEVMHGDAHGT